MRPAISSLRSTAGLTKGFDTLDLKEAKALLMSCMPDRQIRNRPDYVAAHESAAGPKRRFVWSWVNSGRGGASLEMTRLSHF